MKSIELKQVDFNYRNHLQAYLNYAVKAEKKAGKFKTKPVYTRFIEFFNYEKEIENVLKEENKQKSRFSGVGKFFKKGG